MADRIPSLSLPAKASATEVGFIHLSFSWCRFAISVAKVGQNFARVVCRTVNIHANDSACRRLSIFSWYRNIQCCIYRSDNIDLRIIDSFLCIIYNT